MWAKRLWLVLAISLICIGHEMQAQTYSTQQITVENATALVPLLAWDHSAPLDTPYPVTPDPTSHIRDSYDLDFVFSPDGRYLAHIINEPLTMWLVDLTEGTERAFLLNATNVTISPDWRTLTTTEQVADSSTFLTRLWDMEALLALPRAPIGESANCRFRVTIGSTNLRESPRVEAASLGYALADQTYPAIAADFFGDWVQVHGETQPAWIGSQYGTLEGNCATLPIRLLAGGERAVIDSRDVEFSPDGRILIADKAGRSSYTTIQAYSADSGELLYELDVVLPLQFSPDNRLMTDYAGRLFEVATGSIRFSLEERIGSYGQTHEYGSRFSLDSRTVAMAGDEGIVRLLDTQDGTELRTFTLPGGEFTEMEFSPDGRYLLISTAERSRDFSLYRTFIWDLTSAPIHVLTTRDTNAYMEMPEFVCDGYDMTFLGDGSGILRTTTNPKTIGVWDMAARDFRFVTHYPVGTEGRARLTPDSDVLVYTASYNSGGALLMFWSTQTGATLSSMTMQHFPNFSPDRRWILTRDKPHAVTLWGVPANAAVPTLPPTATRTPTATITPTPPGFIPTAEPTGSGNFYLEEIQEREATATAQAVIQALTPTMSFTPSPTALPTATPFIITPQPGAETITASNYQQIMLLNTLLPRASYYHFTRFTPDGSRLITARGSTVIVWDVRRGERIATFDEHPAYIVAMDVSQDGQYVLTLAGDDVLRLWALETSALVNSITVEGIPYGDLSLQISPDNRRVLVLEQEQGAYGGRRLRVRDLETGEIVLDQEAPQNTTGGFRPDSVAVWWSPGVVFSSESIQTGQYFLYEAPGATTVVASADLTRLATFDTEGVNIRIWDTAGGHDPVLLQGHTAPVREVYFSPDARLLVSFDADGDMRVWNTVTGENLTAIPEGMLPAGMPVGNLRILLAAEDGAPIILELQETFGALAPDSLRMTADGATIAASASQFVLLFGVPTAERPAYASVPAWVVPSAINVRSQPSLDMAPDSRVEKGIVVVAGRDASGQFVYLPGVKGWVLADPAYLNLGSLTVEQLPIRET